MLKYRFRSQYRDVNGREEPCGCNLVDFPFIETRHDKMSPIIADLSMKLRIWITSLIRKDQPIPIVDFVTDHNLSIYLPAATTWRVLLWNEFIRQGYTLKTISEHPIVIACIPQSQEPIEYVRRIFDMTESTKYRHLVPFADILGMKIEASISPKLSTVT